MGGLAKTPEAPYYVVTFTSLINDDYDEVEYTRFDDLLMELAPKQKGYLGIESARNDAGFGITLSYWRDRIDVLNWKKQSEHAVAQQRGKESFYKYYAVRVCKVEKAYEFHS